jgi:hypothetical protein
MGKSDDPRDREGQSSHQKETRSRHEDSVRPRTVKGASTRPHRTCPARRAIQPLVTFKPDAIEAYAVFAPPYRHRPQRAGCSGSARLVWHAEWTNRDNHRSRRPAGFDPSLGTRSEDGQPGSGWIPTTISQARRPEVIVSSDAPPGRGPIEPSLRSPPPRWTRGSISDRHDPAHQPY